jgi:hypothetical protein
VFGCSSPYCFFSLVEPLSFWFSFVGLVHFDSHWVLQFLLVWFSLISSGSIWFGPVRFHLDLFDWLKYCKQFVWWVNAQIFCEVPCLWCFFWLFGELMLTICWLVFFNLVQFGLIQFGLV